MRETSDSPWTESYRVEFAFQATGFVLDGKKFRHVVIDIYDKKTGELAFTTEYSVEYPVADSWSP
jgi:hypothetical protein